LYILIGFLVVSYNEESPQWEKKYYSVFEEYHISAALWWRAFMCVFFLLLSWTFFIPYLNILTFLLYIVCLVVYVYMVFRVYHWQIIVHNPITDFLYGLGKWILTIFDKEIRLDPSSESENDFSESAKK
jgi:hypothetical protein